MIIYKILFSIGIFLSFINADNKIPELVWIKGGSFMIKRINKYGDIEKSKKKVTVKGFYIGKFETTQKEYHTLMFNTYKQYKKPDWKFWGEGDNYPAYNIIWYDAILYCNALSKRDGLDTVYSYTNFFYTLGNDSRLENIKININKNGYRLPTETEWEYAYRAGTTTKYYWGNFGFSRIIKQYAWYQKNADDDNWSEPHAEKEGTQPVGNKKSNAWGLHDMAGNVSEWCNEIYRNFFSKLDLEYDEAGVTGVGRGGGWRNKGKSLSGAFRHFHYTGHRSYYFGFRVARNK